MQVRLCDTATCRCVRQYTVGGERASGAGAVTAIAWFPGSRRFLAATHKAVEVFDARPGGGSGGGLLHRLRPPHAFTYDAAVVGADCVVTVGQDRKIGFTRCSCWLLLLQAVLPACALGWVPHSQPVMCVRGIVRCRCAVAGPCCKVLPRHPHSKPSCLPCAG